MDKSVFDGYRIGEYQRDNFDKFLKSIHFRYSVPSVHVTGTNGKGSTVTYIANAYIANGYKVGLFNSPFLKEPNEMISINGKNISDEDFFSIMEQYKKEIKKYDLYLLHSMFLIPWVDSLGRIACKEIHIEF